MFHASLLDNLGDGWFCKNCFFDLKASKYEACKCSNTNLVEVILYSKFFICGRFVFVFVFGHEPNIPEKVFVAVTLRCKESKIAQMNV